MGIGDWALGIGDWVPARREGLGRPARLPAGPGAPGSGVALLTLLCCALIGGWANADSPAPASQPDAMALLDPVARWVKELSDADPAVRAGAAARLGGSARPEAVGPLIGLLLVRHEAVGRMRVVGESRPAGSGRALGIGHWALGRPAPGTQPDPDGEVGTADPVRAHAERISTEPFLAELLGNERAGNWLWVRRHREAAASGAAVPSPRELAGQLDSATSAGPSPEPNQLIVRVEGPDGPSAVEMVNLVMAIYQSQTEKRFKQRAELLDLNARLGQARGELADRQRALDEFGRANNVAEVQRLYEAAANQAGPLLKERDRLRAELARAHAAANNLQADLDRAQRMSDQRLNELHAARTQLALVQANPTNPLAAWQQRVTQLQDLVRNLENDWLRRQREIDRLAPTVARAQTAADRVAERVTAIEFRIDAIFGDIDDRYVALKEQIKPLADAAQAAYQAAEALAAKAAKLPPIGELESADSFALVVARAGAAEPGTQPLAVRLAAVEALGRLGDQSRNVAVAPLIDLLTDADPSLRAAAADALTRITGQALGADPAKWRAWLAERSKPIPLP